MFSSLGFIIFFSARAVMFKQKPIFSVYPTVNRSELKRDKKKQTKEKQPNGFCL